MDFKIDIGNTMVTTVEKRMENYTKNLLNKPSLQERSGNCFAK